MQQVDRECGFRQVTERRGRPQQPAARPSEECKHETPPGDGCVDQDYRRRIEYAQDAEL